MPACLRSEFNLCQNGLAEWKIKPEVAPHFRSGFATHYYVFPGQYFYKVPDEVDDAAVAGANCGLAQMLFSSTRSASGRGRRWSSRGPAASGCTPPRWRTNAGREWSRSTAVPERLELARSIRCRRDHQPRRTTRTPRTGSPAVQELTDGMGADMVLEVTGVPASFVEAIDMARVGGRIASVGNLNAEATRDHDARAS